MGLSGYDRGVGACSCDLVTDRGMGVDVRLNVRGGYRGRVYAGLVG